MTEPTRAQMRAWLERNRYHGSPEMASVAAHNAMLDAITAALGEPVAWGVRIDGAVYPVHVALRESVAREAASHYRSPVTVIPLYAKRPLTCSE